MDEKIIAFRTIKAWLKKWLFTQHLNSDLVNKKALEIECLLARLENNDILKQQLFNCAAIIQEASTKNISAIDLFTHYFNQRTNIKYIEQSIEKERMMVAGVKTRKQNGK